MQPFTIHDGLIVPLLRDNIDTDAIIPKQFLKAVARTGFGPYLFDEWRYRDHGEWGVDCARRPLHEDFPLNQARYRGATILLTGRNFGCGSSREHAPWALAQFGFRALLAPSFADIFRSNCLKNGLLPITLPAEALERIASDCAVTPGYRLTIDLPAQCVRSGALAWGFELDAASKHNLLNGLDEIGLTLAHRAAIAAFEAQHLARQPWLGQRLQSERSAA